MGQKVFFAAVDQDEGVSVELFATEIGAKLSIKGYVWDHWEKAFEQEKPEDPADVTEEDIEKFTSYLGNTSKPVYFEIGEAEIPRADNPHKVVSLLGKGIRIEPSRTGSEGFDLFIPNLSMKDLESQIRAIEESLLENSIAGELVDLLNDVMQEYQQYRKENPLWEK